MTPEVPQSHEQSVAGMSEIARISGIFFEPTKTFEDIAARPRWFVPLILVVLAVCVTLFVFSQRMGWERVVREQIESSSAGQQLTPEQREQRVAMGARVAPIFAYLSPLVGLPVVDLVLASLFLGIVGGIMSAPVKFKQVFAVVCYSALPALISSALTIIVIFLKKPEDYNMRNPLMFNPAAAMDPTSTSKFVYSLASSLDLFSFWTIFLLATGLKAAGGKKISFTGALFAVLIPWAIYVFCKSAVAGMFS